MGIEMRAELRILFEKIIEDLTNSCPFDGQFSLPIRKWLKIRWYLYIHSHIRGQPISLYGLLPLSYQSSFICQGV